MSLPLDQATKSLLVELFVEELPPKALKKLGEAFAQGLTSALKGDGLLTDGSVTTSYASPRRLAAHVSEVRGKALAKRSKKKLMPASIAFTASGDRSDALKKRLLKEGYANFVDGPASRLVRELEGGTEYLYLDSEEGGMSLAFHLDFALRTTLAGLPIPKLMTYQPASGDVPGWSNVQFVRPAHGLVALHGADVVPVTALGLVAGRDTHGHRFEARIDPIVLAHADEYAERLRDDGAVIASFADRRAEIERQLQQAAAAEGLAAPVDDALVDEVTALVERPNVLLGRFDASFLAVPPECLVLTMKANQKYFPLLDAAGKLTNRFLIVSNISPADPGRVIEGNERVVRPRLADAKFFFDQDRKKTLESRVAGLDKVVYHGKLGSQGDRALRVAAIAQAIVAQLRTAAVPYTVEAKDQFDVLDSKVRQAARLAKTDLLTDMVGEFPELQGVMGGTYARAEGLRDGVAIAIEDHYKPRFAGDALPRNHTGTVLALADKLETLVGLFGIGQVPTGDKDPFALRRHALGVIRLLTERGLRLGLTRLITEASAHFSDISNAGAALADFFYERLRVSLRDQGYSANESDAVLALRPDLLVEVEPRARAVRSFGALVEAQALAAANKRVTNILNKSPQSHSMALTPALLKEPAEAALAAALAEVQPVADAAFERGDYTASLQALAALKDPVDAFFEHVMVNVDDEKLRAHRLGLLATLHAAMNRVADLSKLAA